MKKLFEEHSGYILFVSIAQIVISIVATLALVYNDSKIFTDVGILEDVEKLVSSVYSQSWWSLMLFSLSFASILTIASIVYKKLEYEFLSIGCIILMIFPAISLNSNLKDTLLTLLLFLPIIGIKAIAYKNEKEKLKIEEEKAKKKATTKVKKSATKKGK